MATLYNTPPKPGLQPFRPPETASHDAWQSEPVQIVECEYLSRCIAAQTFAQTSRIIGVSGVECEGHHFLTALAFIPAPSNGHKFQRLRIQLRGALGEVQHLNAHNPIDSFASRSNSLCDMWSESGNESGYSTVSVLLITV